MRSHADNLGIFGTFTKLAKPDFDVAVALEGIKK